ncbi:MAG: hypothetical protein KatS3mg022_2589 [Armatimonadota bacterium]|nr:MAG: hypothetical protein KatS3mg022_2589 [Armatimonadota bacterium]
MVRTLVVTLGVFVVSITAGFAQVIEWNTPTVDITRREEGAERSTSAQWSTTTYDLWSQANANVWWRTNPNVSSLEETIITVTQTGRITSIGDYNSVRVYGRVRHYSYAYLTFYSGSLTQYYKSEGTVAVTSHNGSSLHATRISDRPWGTEYSPNSGMHLLVDVPNWNGTPISLSRISTAHARASRVGINLLNETVETTSTISVQGYNR